MIYKPVTIYETITSITPASEIVCQYEHTRNGVTKMHHTATTIFKETNENTTEINQKIDQKIDQKVIGLIPRIVMKLMANAVKKTPPDEAGRV